MRLPAPVFMADIARAMQTPPPAPEPEFSPKDGRDPTTLKSDPKREAKNERDRLRRKAQRAAAAKEAEAAAAKPKKKKTKKRTLAEKIDAAYDVAGIRRATSGKRKIGKSPALAAPYGKKRRRGRPPGAKNKPKLGLAVALVPTPGVLPRGRVKAASLSDNSLLAQINSAVLLLNAMPEHARKVVLDAVK